VAEADEEQNKTVLW